LRGDEKLDFGDHGPLDIADMAGHVLEVVQHFRQSHTQLCTRLGRRSDIHACLLCMRRLTIAPTVDEGEMVKAAFVKDPALEILARQGAEQ
jgi:hypothetical protein